MLIGQVVVYFSVRSELLLRKWDVGKGQDMSKQNVQGNCDSLHTGLNGVNL